MKTEFVKGYFKRKIYPLVNSTFRYLYSISAYIQTGFTRRRVLRDVKIRNGLMIVHFNLLVMHAHMRGQSKNTLSRDSWATPAVISISKGNESRRDHDRSIA